MRLSKQDEGTGDHFSFHPAYSIVFLAIVVTVFTAWFTHQSIIRWSLLYSDWQDLGSIDSAAYNTVYGNFMFSNSRLYSFWSDHFSPILLVLSLYYVFDDSYYFIFLWQASSVALTAIPLFLISKHFLKNEYIALLISFAYLANGNIHMGILYDYHMISHVGLFALSAFYFMLKRRWGWYLFFGTLLMFLKEDTPIIFFMMGFYAAFALKEYRAAAITWAYSGA